MIHAHTKDISTNKNPKFVIFSAYTSFTVGVVITNIV